MVFVGDEVQLDVSFAVARERLLQLAEDGVLLSTSQDAYDLGTTGFERVGIPGLSKLVNSHFEPARFFGQPVRGLAVLSFSGVSVRG